MRISRNHIVSLPAIALGICFAGWGLTSAQAQTPDNDRAWTTTGSAGTVDVADLSKVFFDKSKVQMGHVLVIKSAAKMRPIIAHQIQSAVIRYNVTAVDGLLTPMPTCRPDKCVGAQLTLRFIADGPSARVMAKLIEVNLATGVETVRLSIDSNVSAPGKGYKTDSIQPDCDATWRFDFLQKAYYIEATLTTSSVPAIGSAAGIQMIKIGFADCL
jgi:hypothetical protein